MADGSTKVVLAALAGNVAIAVAKFGAYAISGSSAMLTEAIHSLVDTADQVLLLVGARRSVMPPNAAHPFGYGGEAYFWSFIVALMVFLVGGALSIGAGVRHILHPHPLGSPWLGYGVLAAAAVFDGLSFVVGYREFRRIVGGRKVNGRRVSLMRFIGISKDPNLFATLLEDSAGIVGVVLAAAGMFGASTLGLKWADGAASIAIGLLLIGVAFIMANETRSLIAGEGVVQPVLEMMEKVLAADGRVAEVEDITTRHLGPNEIMVALTLSFDAKLTSGEAADAVRDLTAALKKAEKRVACVYVRPPLHPAKTSGASRKRSGSSVRRRR
jgi:cation diffusion facilitator family transporter